MPTLWTIGYERLPPDALVAEQLRERAPALRVVDL
jgi:hypothetical protein